MWCYRTSQGQVPPFLHPLCQDLAKAFLASALKANLLEEIIFLPNGQGLEFQFVQCPALDQLQASTHIWTPSLVFAKQELDPDS